MLFFCNRVIGHKIAKSKKKTLTVSFFIMGDVDIHALQSTSYQIIISKCSSALVLPKGKC